MDKESNKNLKGQEEEDPWKALDMGREYGYTTDKKQVHEKTDIAETGEDTEVKELYQVEKAKRQDSSEPEKKFN